MALTPSSHPATEILPHESNFEGWFETLVPKPTDATVLCFPYSGSGASMFARWKDHLEDRISLFALKLPGRESRLNETPRTDLVVTAKQIAKVVKDHPIGDGRICLAGFSLGALLAFEVARHLRREGVNIKLLVAGAARAPQGRWSRGRLHRLSDEKFLTRLNQQYAAVPASVFANAEMRKLLLPMLRGDIEMFETYEYQSEPALDCEILTLSGTEDGMVKPKHVYPWREQGRSFRHRSFAGDHYFAKSQTKAMMDAINARLRRTLGE